MYTVLQKKQATWCLIISSANVDRFSKFFHQVIRKKILYVYVTKIFTSPAVCCYTTLCKSRIQKMSLTLTASQQIVDMFPRTLWGLDLTFNSSQGCSHWLTDWLTFWSLSDNISNQQLDVLQLKIGATWWFSPWLSSFYAILRVLYTYLS